MMSALSSNQKKVGKVAIGAVITGFAVNLFYGFFTRPKDHTGPYFPTGLDAAGILNIGSLTLCGVGCAVLFYLLLLEKTPAAPNNNLAQNPALLVEDRDDVVPETTIELQLEYVNDPEDNSP